MLPGYRSAALSLVALLPVLASGSSEAQAGGQISGHVYRSDGGQAVPGAVVTLIPVADHGKALTARAAQDGSYSFQAPDLQGQYFVTAWFRGFNLAFYRVAEPGPPRTFGRVINLKSGTRFDNTDLRLTRMAQITQMHDGQLAATYPTERGDLDFGTGRFSADGQHFAFTTTGVYMGDPEQAWNYDMKLGRLESITGKAVKSEPTKIFEVGIHLTPVATISCGRPMRALRSI